MKEIDEARCYLECEHLWQDVMHRTRQMALEDILEARDAGEDLEDFPPLSLMLLALQAVAGLFSVVRADGTPDELQRVRKMGLEWLEAAQRAFDDVPPVFRQAFEKEGDDE